MFTCLGPFFLQEEAALRHPGGSQRSDTGGGESGVTARSGKQAVSQEGAGRALEAETLWPRKQRLSQCLGLSPRGPVVGRGSTEVDEAQRNTARATPGGATRPPGPP